MAKWSFSALDNSGKRQHFIVNANDKINAIKIGMVKAKEKANGSIVKWDCKLKSI